MKFFAKTELKQISNVFRRFYHTETLFTFKPFKLHNLSTGPEESSIVTADDAETLYQQMITIRRLEMAAGNLYKSKQVRGFCHLYSGQEAVAVGMKSVMRSTDSIISAYRVHAWTYLMGISLEGVLCELTGRKSGCARGKGGSMHMYAKNFYGGNGIVGAQVSLGAGIALANKYRQDGGICFAMYGDGASNQGQVFESYNMAYLWKLPCIFVCENNQYGMGTSASRSSCNTEYYKRGDVLPGIWVDGMDVVSCRTATEWAINYAKEFGPIVMEFHTYRYSGHSMSDPGTSYRSREEIQDVRLNRDPITIFREKCLDAGILTAEKVKLIDEKIKERIQKATTLAQTENEVILNELTTDIYCKNIETNIRGVSPSQGLLHGTLGQAININ